METVSMQNNFLKGPLRLAADKLPKRKVSVQRLKGKGGISLPI